MQRIINSLPNLLRRDGTNSMPEEEIQTPENGTDVVPPVTTPPVQPVIPPTPPAPDYEKKFSESSRENQLLAERIKALEDSGKDLTKEPTDSELRAAFPSWEVYDDTQKELARRTFNSERTAGNARAIAQKLSEDQSWNTSIELVVTSDPALQGKEQAFRQFASQPKYRSIPMDVLVAAFLNKAGSPAAPRTPPKPGLEPGNGGPRTTETPKTLTSEQLTAIRTTDPKAYQDYLKTHEINVDV